MIYGPILTQNSNITVIIPFYSHTYMRISGKTWHSYSAYNPWTTRNALAWPVTLARRPDRPKFDGTIAIAVLSPPPPLTQGFLMHSVPALTLNVQI